MSPRNCTTRGEDADGRRDGDERRVGVADRAREQHDERDHEHRGEREGPPEQHERRAAGAELREHVGGRLAQDVGVVEARGQQRERGIERDRDDDQQQSGDGRGGHGRGGSETRSSGSSSCSRGGCVLRDLVGDVLRVVFDPAEQRGASGVLPGHAEEVEAGRGCHAARVDDCSVVAEDGGIDVGVVDAEPRRPDHGPGVERRSVGERDRRSGGGSRPRSHVDTAPADRPGAGADERVTATEPAADPGVDGLAHQPGRGQDREEVASERALGERRLS